MTHYTKGYPILLMAAFLFFASCKKDQLPAPVAPSGGNTDQPVTTTTTLVAKSWVREATYSYYSCDLYNVLPGTGTPIIYLETGGQSFPISNWVRYMNGILSVTTDKKDARLKYVCDVSTDGIPFNAVTIKIEIH